MAKMEETGPTVRLCVLKKWTDHDGYGFNLHAEKNKSGVHRIGQVEKCSPAQAAGLREGDLIVEVNGVNVSTENHRQVVERIKAVPAETRLLVVDEAADKWYKARGLIINGSQPNIETMQTPDARPDSSHSGRQSSASSHRSEPAAGEAIENGVHRLKIESVANEVESNNNDPPSEKIVTSSTTTTTITPVPDANNKTASQNHNGGSDGEAGDGSSRTSTPASEPKSAAPANGPTTDEQSSAPNTPVIKEPIVQQHPSGGNESRGSNGSAASSNSSVPASPATSTKSGASSSGNKSLPPCDTLNLNMSVSEMRAYLAQKKKHDAKKAGIDLRQKYEIIQQM